MDYYKSVLLCGGDKRQKYLKDFLKQDGIDAKTYALGLDSDVCIKDIPKFDVVILPMPVSRDGVLLNSPLVDFETKLCDLFNNFSKTQTILGGICKGFDIDIIDYYDNEKLQMLNAIPTVEGALQIAMQNTDFTIHGANCMVIGFGRIGKLLAQRLKSMGANVTVCARSQKDIALANAFDISGKHINSISEGVEKFDIIFNTVPFVLLDLEVLLKIDKSTPIIELASKPYGVDIAAAELMKRNVIISQGLPGKVAPKTSAKILKNVILEMLIGMEV